MPERRVNWHLVILLKALGWPHKLIAERCNCTIDWITVIWRRRAEVIGGPRDG